MTDVGREKDGDHGRSPVLVTGATGRIGRGVVDELVAAGVPVRALTRDPSAATLPDAVDVVAGDFTEPGSLRPALDGVATVFLVWTAPIDALAPVVDMLAERPRRVVVLSAPHRTPHPFFQQPNPMAAMHVELERLVAAAGLGATYVRPGMFASNAPLWWGRAIREGDVVRWPYADAETAPVDERDVAAVAARLLRDDVEPGGDHVLTGPQGLTHAEQVATIGEVIGRPLRLEELTPDEFRAATAGTWPQPAVEMLLDAWGATLGHAAYVTTTVSDLLGVPARTFRESMADAADSFRAGPDR